jgi:hypothetical protein
MLNADTATRVAQHFLKNTPELQNQQIVDMQEHDWGWRFAATPTPGRISFATGYVYLKKDGDISWSPIPKVIN